MKMIESYSEEETFALGQKLAENASPGDIFCLDGDLGAGKTVFARGFAAGLGITEPITSPTFTIIKEYEDGRIPFYHFDVYRIGDPGEMEMLGYEEYFYGKGVCLIEWSSLIEELLPQYAVRIGIFRDDAKGPDYRRIEMEERI